MKERGTEDFARERQKLLACLEVGKSLTSTLELGRILELIMLKVTQLIDAQNWSLLLRDPATGELTFRIVTGIHAGLVQDIPLAKGEGIAGEVAETGVPLFVPDVRKHPKFSPKIDARTGFQTRSIVCLPLKSRGKVLGVMEIINLKDLEAFQTGDFPFLSVLADYAAIAIENARVLERIQQMGWTDEYTGLRNARFLHRMLDELTGPEAGPSENFAVVFVDVDNFKTVVDRHGHLLGSQVLKEIGETLLTCLGERDVLVKYGGDEYVFVLPGRGKEEAFRLTQKVRQALRSSVYLRGEAEPVRVTASFGLAAYPQDASTKKDLLLLADSLMYGIKKAKKDGIGVLETRN